MFDICFSECLSRSLIEIKKSINSEGVLLLGLHLNYGLLDCDIIKEQTNREVDTLRYFYNSITEEELQVEYEELLDERKQEQENLKGILNDNKEIRIWLSNNANDRCGLFWLCHIAKEYSSKIFTVVCPGYSYSLPGYDPYESRNWSLYEPEFIAEYADKIHFLNEDEIFAYSETWKRIVKENTKFRVLIDDIIVSVEEDFFDNVIMSYIAETPQSQTTIINRYLREWYCADFCFASQRIEYLIEKGKIKIVEDKVDSQGSYIVRMICQVESQRNT